MTIEGRPLSAWLRSLGRIARAITLVTCGWFAVVVALTFMSAPGKSMAIVGPQTQTVAAVVKANGRILASNRYVTIARSDDAGFVVHLYAAGALLVLDAEQAGGCSGLPPQRFTASL
jgi:multidrug efflux pump subunit AcrA (membrane-fusion protein)